jgi:hypothetical protein
VKPLLVSFALLGIVAAYLWPGDVTKHPPGVLVYDEPAQSVIGNGTSWHVKDYTLKPLADYRIRARVLMTERYWMGREADLSPLDLTLGWRRMSDQAVLDRISFTRQRRAYCYRPKGGSDWPIPAAEIIARSANMHLIPATAEVDAALKSFHAGDVIDLSGQLVEVTTPDGWRWRSSLTRTDDGQGSCELMWVREAARRP